MKSTHVLPVLIATATASLVLAGGAGATRSNPVACGDTITASVKLDNDLTDCPSNGIVIGADGITLDLNGHTIDGDDALQDCEPGADCDLGVLNLGHRAVTITGGAIGEFGIGLVVAAGADDNRLRDLAVTANEFVGISMDDSKGGEISRSSVTRNGIATEGVGIALFSADHSRVTRDVVSANGDSGIAAYESRRILIADNVVNDQPLGIATDHVDDSAITRNRTLRSAVVLIGDHNTLSRNYVAGTARCPDDVCGEGGAISFEGGTGNVIEQNLVERTLEPGIRVAAFEPETPPADGNTVRHNVIRGALDGIRVQETATHTLLDGNLAVGSADDGIDVANAATTLRRNVADRNDDLGIEAVTGVTDGGHNRAHGNGNPAQCLNVSCH